MSLSLSQMEASLLFSSTSKFRILELLCLLRWNDPSHLVLIISYAGLFWWWNTVRWSQYQIEVVELFEFHRNKSFQLVVLYWQIYPKNHVTSKTSSNHDHLCWIGSLFVAKGLDSFMFPTLALNFGFPWNRVLFMGEKELFSMFADLESVTHGIKSKVGVAIQPFLIPTSFLI